MSIWDLHWNWLGIIIAAVVNLILGSFWYSPYLFGKAWVDANKFDMKSLVGTPLHYVGALIVSLLTAWVLDILLHHFNITSYSVGASVAFWIWLGFIATSHFSGVLWAKRPLKSYIIDTIFSLVSLLVMSMILLTLK